MNIGIDIDGADVKARGQVIIDSKDLDYNYKFARDVTGADVIAHGQVIMDSKDLDYNLVFARAVKGADIKAHGKIILASGDVDYNSKFMKIRRSDIAAHEAAINETKLSYCEKFLDDCLDSLKKEKVRIKKKTV